MNPSIDSMSVDVSDEDMLLFQHLFQQYIGLHLPLSKKTLLCSRFSRRLGELNLSCLREYYNLISLPKQQEERQRAIDLITTNETYFFRERRHFDVLREEILPLIPARQLMRVWSAASSTGEEAYSLAMLLNDCRPDGPWRIFASDISQRVLTFARRGLYPMVRGQNIPDAYLTRFCLCGTGDYDGHFLVNQKLRAQVQFDQRNLLRLPDDMDEQFDVIFLRNVIIYFDFQTKVEVIRSVARKLKPGGWLVVGHSESLHGMPTGLQMHTPSIYRRLP